MNTLYDPTDPYEPDRIGKVIIVAMTIIAGILAVGTVILCVLQMLENI